MDFGVMTAKIDEIGYVTHAENLGFSHCWVTDSPIIRSNCWAVLALAAQATRPMRLGTGVNVPALRLAPAAANGIATINRLAPGRCFIGFGTGHTGLRLLGRKPMRLAPFRAYVEVVWALMLANARRGAERGGRTLPADFYTSAMVTLVMREHDEPLDSQRILAECGAAVLSGLHYLVAHHLETGEDPPDYARSIWKAYLGWLDEAPPEVRHQRLHGSHYSFLDPKEARFLTADLIRGSTLSGTPDELVEQVRELERQGLKQIMLYPPLNRQYRVIEDFAAGVLARL
jgi:alkanesulfonate monooxygenase SsuD/methylene tetrahydromethanopterin reductase-like flavin-dependent oxidoreductase (luciferase family)